VTRISSSLTRFNKWVFPLLWIGFLVFFVGSSIADGVVEKDPMFLIGPVVVAVIGAFMFRHLVWDLADAVDDHGSHLVVRRRGREVRIALSNIMNVNISMATSPQRVTLRLVEPCEFGANVVFSPKSPLTLNPFAKNEIAENLMERAYAARVSAIR